MYLRAKAFELGPLAPPGLGSCIKFFVLLGKVQISLQEYRWSNENSSQMNFPNKI